MESVRRVECAVPCTGQHYNILVECTQVSNTSLPHWKNTSILPVLHMLHRSFSSNLTCHFLTFFFLLSSPSKREGTTTIHKKHKNSHTWLFGKYSTAFDVSFCIWWYTGVLSIPLFSLSFSYLYTGKVFSDTSILMHSFLCEPFGCIQEGQLHQSRNQKALFFSQCVLD